MWGQQLASHTNSTHTRSGSKRVTTAAASAPHRTSLAACVRTDRISFQSACSTARTASRPRLRPPPSPSGPESSRSAVLGTPPRARHSMTAWMQRKTRPLGAELCAAATGTMRGSHTRPPPGRRRSRSRTALLTLFFPTSAARLVRTTRTTFSNWRCCSSQRSRRIRRDEARN